MDWKLTVLGSNSAVPTRDRYPSAQVLSTDRESFLIDCGEGTQIRMSEFGIRRSRINHIFISHLHGDHIFGLPGLITSYNLFGRTSKLTLYGPKGLRAYINHNLEAVSVRMQYDIEIFEHQTVDKQVIWKNENIQVDTIPLIHRVPTTGYLFREVIPLRRIDPTAVASFKVPYTAMSTLQEGANWTAQDGTIIENEKLTFPNRSPKSYAYCSDTAYHEPIVEQIDSIDLLYHEATFANELAKEAEKRKHSTAKQAALIAKKAQAKRLMIGHFSSRYKDPQQLLHEAEEVFKPTILAVEGITVSI